MNLRNSRALLGAGGSPLATRVVALALTVLTGFTGLVYQVAWQRYLGTLLGSHSEATASVLGIFLGGLSLGYALFGKLTHQLALRAEDRRRPAPLLLLYGAVEATIGLYALLFPALFRAVHALSLQVPQTHPGLAFGIDVGMAMVLLGPPTVLMGGTIPVLTQALARSVADATRLHAFVYAFNTAGAFAGALAAGFYLVPALGLVGVMHVMGVLNLAAGAVFLGLGAPRPGVLAPPEPAPSGGPVRDFAPYAAVALLSGFAMMTLETVLIRVGGLVFGSSEFTFAMVVAVFVLCIALGSFAVSLLPRIPPSLLLINQTALVVLLVGIYGLMPRAPYEAHVLRTVFSLQDVAFYPYYLAAFASLLLLTGLPVVLSGATLPLLFHALRRERGDLGGVAGRLYSWNTVGSLLGALLGGYALLFWLDLHHVYRIALAALLLGALILAVLRVGARNAWIAVAAALPLSAALYRLPAWSPKAFATGAYRARTAGSLSYAGAEAFYRGWWRGRKLLFYQDGPTLSAAILEQRLPDEESFRALLVNGKPDGATAVDSITMGLLGVLPALFVDPVERAFVIGYGTGVTAGELAALDSTREVVVAEISSAVLEGAPLFDFANGGVTQNPKVRLVRSDAYRALMRDPRRFDVIASAPSNPWVTGVEMLYSREFLEAARRRLTPRGVYIQFFQQYEIDSPTVALVLRTYADVFDHVAVWYGSGPDLLLLGFNDPTAALDVGRLEQRAAQPDIAAGLRRAGIESFPALITHELLPLGVVRALALEGPIHTLYDPILNHRAARAYFRGENARLPFSGFDGPAQVGAEHSLLQRYARRFGGALPEARRRESVMEACRHRARQCTTLLAAWEREHGDTPALRRTREAAAATNFRRFGGSVDAATARELIGLFPAADGKPPEADSPEALARDTSRFAAFYAHAAPFDPERLLRRWERCEARPETSEACGAGLARARALLRSEGSSIHTAVAETVP